MYLSVVLSIIIVILVICLYSKLSHSERHFSQIPGLSNSWPCIGDTFTLLRASDNLFQFFRDLHNQFPTISRLSGFNARFVNLYEPEDIEKILSSPQFNQKNEPYLFLRPWLGQGLLVSNGKKWLMRRKILTPAFHFNILKQFSKTFSERSAALLKELDEETTRQSTDLGPIISKATLRIMCVRLATLMGTQVRGGIEATSNEYFKAVHFLGESIVYRSSRLWLHLDNIFKWTKMFRKQKAALNKLHGFTDQIIKERKQQRLADDSNENETQYEDNYYEGKRKMAMLDLLLENQRKGNIDDMGIREEVDTFMFEGHDTTAMALCYILMAIANEQQVQDKIFEECQEIFGELHADPTMEHLSKMKYLECCIKETLRLYPSVPYVARYLNNDVILSGYLVPAGSIVGVHIFDLHRRPDLYLEPDKFIPERFMPQSFAKMHPYAYITFSAGPRNCIGQKFAMLEMKTLVSSIVRRFRLLPVTTPDQLQFTMDLVLRTKNPIRVAFRRR